MPDGGRFSHEVADALQPPADVNAGDHSAAMLAKLDQFTQMMATDKIGFLYEKWRTHPACLPENKSKWSARPWGQENQEKTDPGGGLYQLKIINWGLMYGAMGRLGNLGKAAGAVDGSVGAIYTKVQAGWTSKAGEAAAGKINDLRAASVQYGTVVGQLRAHIEGARNTSRQAVEKLSKFCETDTGGKDLIGRFGRYGGGEGGGQEIREDMSRYMDEMKRILSKDAGGDGKGVWARWPERCEEANGATNDSTKQVGVAEMNAAGQVYLTDGNNRWSDQICRELNEICDGYHLAITNFRRQVDETVKAVKEAWGTLQAGADSIAGSTADPFGKLTLSGPSQPPKEEKKEGKTEPQEKKEQGGGGKDHSRTESGGGDGREQAKMPPPPKVEMPDPTDPAGVTDPTKTDPTKTDPTKVPGKDDIDPTTPPGAVDPNDPTKGQQGTPGGQPAETVTIKDGDRTISVQSPDGQGRVKVTVDDGTGHPKTYDLDFGAATGQPQPTPQQPLDPGFGPRGSAQNGLIGGPEQIPAGPDGKAVIQDGPLTITAERPDGSPDTVRVTVDNGTGAPPTTYTLDYQDGTAQQGQPGIGQPEQAVGQRPIPAMYAGEPVSRDTSAQGAVMGGGSYAATPAGVPSADAAPVPSWETGATHAASDLSGSAYASSEASGGAVGSVLDGGGFSHVEDRDGDSRFQATGPGEAGLSSAQDGGAGHAQPGGQAGSGFGGMPMGGMGGGATGGGEQERGSGSQWRTTGNLFDEDWAMGDARMGDSLGAEGSR